MKRLTGVAGRVRSGSLALTAVLLMLAAGCKAQAAVPPREVTDDDLRSVTLTATDLPPGFRLDTEKLTTNEEYAREGFTKNSEKAREVLDAWGRVSGIESTFRAAEGAPERPRQPVILGAEVHRFSDADHAHRSFDSHELDEYSDGQTGSLTRLAEPRLGDESQMERSILTGGNREMVVYSIWFRHGAVVVSVSSAAFTHLDDKGEHVTKLARLLSERAHSRLP